MCEPVVCVCGRRESSDGAQGCGIVIRQVGTKIVDAFDMKAETQSFKRGSVSGIWSIILITPKRLTELEWIVT